MKKGLHKFKKVCYDNPRWEISMIFGPVAQLGERTVRIRKVVGSNPFRSTKKEETTVGCLFFFGFRRTFQSIWASELPECQGFRTVKTLVTRHSAHFLVSPAAGG